MDFINNPYVGPGPVIFGQDQLVSVVADPPDSVIFMFTSKRL